MVGDYPVVIIPKINFRENQQKAGVNNLTTVVNDHQGISTKQPHCYDLVYKVDIDSCMSMI